VSNWKAMIVSPSAETGRRLQAALAEAGVREPAVLSEYAPRAGLGAIVARQGCNLCFIDLADEEPALAAVAEASGAARVVGLDPRQQADVMLRALRRGAVDFLSDPAPDQVRGVLARLEQQHTAAPAARQPKVYCVTPGKPGCGASTVAVHLAAEERGAGRAVLLVDTDPLTGGAAFLLKLRAERHFDDVLRDWKRMDEELWRRLVVSWRGVDVALAPEDPDSRCAMPAGAAAEMAAFWRERYDVTIVDTPDVRTAVDSGFAASADAVLVVTTNELSPLHATRRAIELLERSSARSRVRLLLNRYDRSTGLGMGEVRTALGTEAVATLPNDYDSLQNAVLDGRPADQGSRFGKGIRGLSRALAGAPPAPAAPRAGLLSRFALRK